MNENENKDIIVAMTGTVTITTEDYAILQRRSALLDVIVAQSNRAKYSTDVDDIVKLVRSMLSPVITGKGEPEENPEDGEGVALSRRRDGPCYARPGASAYAERHGGHILFTRGRARFQGTGRR